MATSDRCQGTPPSCARFPRGRCGVDQPLSQQESRFHSRSRMMIFSLSFSAWTGAISTRTRSTSSAQGGGLHRHLVTRPRQAGDLLLGGSDIGGVLGLEGWYEPDDVASAVGPAAAGSGVGGFGAGQDRSRLHDRIGKVGANPPSSGRLRSLDLALVGAASSPEKGRPRRCASCSPRLGAKPTTTAASDEVGSSGRSSAGSPTSLLLFRRAARPAGVTRHVPAFEGETPTRSTRP